MRDLFVLDSHDVVVLALLTYTDWWQPATSSVLQVGPARRANALPEAFRAGLLETLDIRTELCRRMQLIKDLDRQVLFLWYVRQLDVKEISRQLQISRRQCFRRKANAIRKLIELGETDQAA
jgi:hypothetical protein